MISNTSPVLELGFIDSYQISLVYNLPLIYKISRFLQQVATCFSIPIFYTKKKERSVSILVVNPIRFYHVKHGHSEHKQSVINAKDICFYQFIGGNSSETEDLINQLYSFKEKGVLVIGMIRFPFRFEGKTRLQTAITQYYKMKEICDAVTYLHSDGMMKVIEKKMPVRDAYIIFDSFEERIGKALEQMLCLPGEMNIDVHDIKSFLSTNRSPLYIHTFEGETFDEPLKQLTSTPYLPTNYTDGTQMILNIGYTQDVDMDAFRQINLRLNDLFHKADLFKLGTYFIDEPGYRFKITLLVNGIEDPFDLPDNMKPTLINSMWLKRKWHLVLQNSQQKWFKKKSEGLKTVSEKEEKLKL